ncbi:MAG TPA: BTAD domain-containing putative transcriptional regulator, partial [Candidatus Limnocylindrales bacterium]|nr:BTAD domain-containing putative transcriptional regulator [Candidatus Limnocylindrales bacterium]
IGAEGVRALNLRVAVAAERVDWRIATRHYLAAGDEDAAQRVLSGAIESILATGSYAAAGELAMGLANGGLRGSSGLVLRSRLAQQQIAITEALDLADQALAIDPKSNAVLLNLAAARLLAGDMAGAMDAGRLLEDAEPSDIAPFGRVFQVVGRTSVDGPLPAAAALVAGLTPKLRQRGHFHFLGVSLFTEALLRLPMGDSASALALADEAIATLGSSSAGVELISARLARAMALAQLGDLKLARAEIGVAQDEVLPGQQVEVAVEAAELEEFFGQPSAALAHLAAVEHRIPQDTYAGVQGLLARSIAHAETGNLEGARTEFSIISGGLPRSTPAFELRRQLAHCLFAVLAGEASAASLAIRTAEMARHQGAGLWESYANVLAAVAASERDPSADLLEVSRTRAVALSMAAEAVVTRLADLSPAAFGAVTEAAKSRPERWIEPVRAAAAGAGRNRLAAASILEFIGEPEDVALLRRLSRSARDARTASLGRSLARKLAPRVLIEDLGRIRVVIGDSVIEASEIRRKVLALLALLLSRTDWATTREEVVDNLWPDLDPQAALNSLNQTVYFLRRVFEPNYREETSPGYVQQDGEAIWLDTQLIDSRSARCVAIVRGITGDPEPDESLELAREYRGKFAIDFLYEEWAGPFRDSLHAAFLRVIEASIRLDVDAGQYARAALLAERANEVEPESDELQLSLARIYRLAGAHAAAAEQYAHYARSARDLGLDPLPMADS